MRGGTAGSQKRARLLRRDGCGELCRALLAAAVAVASVVPVAVASVIPSAVAVASVVPYALAAAVAVAAPRSEF